MFFGFYRKKIPKICYNSSSDWETARDFFCKNIQNYVNNHFSQLGAYNGVYGPHELSVLVEYYEQELNSLTKNKCHKWCKMWCKKLYDFLYMCFSSIIAMKNSGEYGDYPFDNWRWQEYKLLLITIIENFNNYYNLKWGKSWLDRIPRFNRYVGLRALKRHVNGMLPCVKH